MALDDYLRLLFQAMRQDSTYSSKRDAWVIPGLTSKIIFLALLDKLPSEFTSIEEVLEEGTRRGLWEMDLDDQYETDIVVMR